VFIQTRTEYHNVVGHAQRQGRRVVYGASDLIEPELFLQQLATLGTTRDVKK
jgi:hypothetical protein